MSEPQKSLWPAVSIGLPVVISIAAFVRALTSDQVDSFALVGILFAGVALVALQRVRATRNR
jgi:hypothetical protein